MSPEETEESLMESSSVAELLLPGPDSESPRSSKRVLVRLYISHFLSTWNSRMFEFGAVLFLASIFKGTLLYASVYALVRSLAAVVCSSWLGSVVDRASRLGAVRQSIVWQRVPVAASCACFVVLLDTVTTPTIVSHGLFVGVALLACVEKLAAMANTVSVERDWAVVISDSLEVSRQDLNAYMRRIDLFCKLLAPVFISLLDGLSTKAAIWTVFGMNAVSVVIEYGAIAQVYKAVPKLARNENGDNMLEESESSTHSLVGYIKQTTIIPWREYTSHSVFLASFSLSLLYLTVLSFGATMVTYLLHTGFSPLEVSGMRIGSVVAELSGTWAAPFIMDRIGPIRSGLWFLNWQSCCLAAAAAGYIFLDASSRMVAVTLIVGVSLSRIGLWGFDLAVQFMVQEGIEEHARARFSSTEMALQNVFELLSFATTIIFPRPEQFKYPVLISYGAIVLAVICFAGYVRKERGHLLHLSKLCYGGDKMQRLNNSLNLRHS
ncbi:putative iron-regulated transporter [Aspergillus chevalieri]|uniref:Solute carrier family 40 member n=1 Tax=Aspergillus chevalieri TaxID=182096 RepID=A0A7R7VQ61_ASPCH|nr:uncharacterized protein ACHE_41316S [Aspergillus chevalieri]BCR88752.1 hypothetical protein ACHE_41316S [Aspergillus chevalieri]